MSFYEELSKLGSSQERTEYLEKEHIRRSQRNTNFYVALPVDCIGGTEPPSTAGELWIPMEGTLQIEWRIGLPITLNQRPGDSDRRYLSIDGRHYDFRTTDEDVAEDFVHLLNMARIDRLDRKELPETSDLSNTKE